MTREEKKAYVEGLVEVLNSNNNIYLADISTLNAEKTATLRRECFKRNISLKVVKNTLLKLAIEQSDKEFGEVHEICKGNTSLMTAEVANDPAKLIKKFRGKEERPALKAAYVEETVYLGDGQLETLVNIKSKHELIAEVVGLLQSPIKTVVSSLQSGGQTLAGIVKTLSEKSE